MFKGTPICALHDEIRLKLQEIHRRTGIARHAMHSASCARFTHCWTRPNPPASGWRIA
jgi:hypothetical protein